MTARVHWHVHSELGMGYLCECDSHWPMTARERDTALRYERDSWRDYVAEGPADDRPRITGSARAGWFDIDGGSGWHRQVRAWSCQEAECLEELDDA